MTLSRYRGALALLAFGCLAGALVTPASAHTATSARQRGDIRVFAHIGAPGEPSLTLVTPKHKVFVGTFEDAAGSDTSPSKVFKYSAHGKLLRTYVMKGQTPGAAHGVQVAARDRHGRLYILDQMPSRIVVLNPHTGRQRNYATFADVPTCSAPHHKNDCSNTNNDGAPEPDYAAWLPDGSLLVTDYSQQLVWRVPPHGGTAHVWLNDKRLNGELFGPAGIVLMPSHRSLLLTVATGGLATAPAPGPAARSTAPTGDASQGHLYRVRLTHHNRPKKLVSLWSSKAGEAPDGFAVSKNRRHVYIAMAGPTGNSVVEVAHRSKGWQTAWTVPKTPNGAGDSPVPWDTATSVQFLGHRILVTNQAFFTGDSSHWVVFDVAAGETGMHLFVPKHAGLRASRGPHQRSHAA